MNEETVSGADLEEDSGNEIDDDFLYHLYQGGDLLRANRVVEAKEHLEKAFELKPANPRGQNLLGLVYFKLGLYHRAIDIYRDLVARFPEDATLWVNLAMVHFKAEQLEEAEEQLRRAISINPDHQNANRYLGLVLVRQGEIEAAKAHFVKAGVRNIEHLIVSQAGEDLPERRQAEIRLAQQQALAEVADQGFRELEEKEIPFRDAGPGTQPPVRPGPEPSATPGAIGALPAERWQAREAGQRADERRPVDTVFELEGEALLIHCHGRVYCRIGPVGWVEGDLRLKPVAKRFAGKETKHPFDRAERAMALVEGEGLLRLDPPEGLDFRLLQHQGETGYYLEELVVAFGDTSSWENGRLPSVGGGDLPIFHLFGDAGLVIGCPGKVLRRPIRGDQRVRLKAARLVGWIGNLVPRLYEAEPPLTDELWIELSGDGEIICLG